MIEPQRRLTLHLPLPLHELVERRRRRWRRRHCRTETVRASARQVRQLAQRVASLEQGDRAGQRRRSGNPSNNVLLLMGFSAGSFLDGHRYRGRGDVLRVRSQ